MLKPERIEGSDEQLERPAERPREDHSSTVREAIELRGQSTCSAVESPRRC